MTAAWVLERIQHLSFLLVAGLALWEYDGYIRAERLEGKMVAEYATKGEAVPEEIVPPRNLISNRRRRRIHQVSLTAFLVALTTLVARIIIT